MAQLEKSMLSVLLVGDDPSSFTVFAKELEKKKGVKVNRASTWKEVWLVIGSCRVDVVVIDETLAEGTALSFVHELTKQHPLINCAMVSMLPGKEFHEMTEGLGVFMQLPKKPGAKEAQKMVQVLESIDALMSM